MQVMMEARVATHLPHHHTTLPYKWVCVCWYHHSSLVSLNVVVVVAHTMEWMKQGHACRVPLITVSLVCVCHMWC